MTQLLNTLSIALSDTRADELVSVLPEEVRAKVRDHSYPLMVKELAKPGDVIASELTFDKFISLMRICATLVTNSGQLDRVKKLTVYNKKDEDLPQAEPFLLDSSAELAKDFEALTPQKAHLLHMAIGLAGEAGEMLEAVLKHIQGAELDVENVIEEAGDALFYHGGILNEVRCSLLECSLHNKIKLLGKRYKNGYSDAAAQERADKPAGE